MAAPIAYKPPNTPQAGTLAPRYHRSPKPDKTALPWTVFKIKTSNNLAFTPQKLGKHVSGNVRGLKQHLPEMPLAPYKRYENQVWSTVKANFPNHKMWELYNIIRDMWLKLNDAEKQVYVDEYEKDKKAYDSAFRAHKASMPHAGLVAANRNKSKVEELYTSSQRQESRIDIQPAEDEDDIDDGGSAYKYAISQRYARNNSLIQTIFSDVVVPDVRSVVTTQRMQVLKRQVTSLTMHQTKLETELQQMEDRHEMKKQKMLELDIKFQADLERHCHPPVTEETIQKMADRMYEEMKRERELQLRANSKAKTEEKIAPKTDKISTSTFANDNSANTDESAVAATPKTDLPEEVEAASSENAEQQIKETSTIPSSNPHYLPPQIPQHGSYGNNLATATRAPYYQPQYGTHPPPSAYGQTAPHTQYQQAPYGAPQQFLAPQYFNKERPQEQNSCENSTSLEVPNSQQDLTLSNNAPEALTAPEELLETTEDSGQSQAN